MKLELPLDVRSMTEYGLLILLESEISNSQPYTFTMVSIHAFEIIVNWNSQRKV